MIPSLRVPWLLLVLVCPLLAVAARAATEQSATRIVGQVLDEDSGAPAEGVTVTITWPQPADGTEPHHEERVTGSDGSFELDDVPAGSYSLRFSKPGYKDAVIQAFAVRPGEANRADLRLPKQAEAPAAAPPGVEEFVVVGTKAEAIEAARTESDKLLNTLSAEELAKFAANDVADALKFVPGVSVVKGQFAIIRGLEDRYSSTLYNGAPIPSPDPDRQSIPLDLFPAEVVSNLAVSKTFAPDLPSNSSGGSIDIITHDYPENFEARFSSAVGINSNARDSFWHLDQGSSVGRESNGWGNVLGNEFGLSVAGRRDVREREYRYKLVLNRQVESNTAEGFEEGREPIAANRGAGISGGLSLGELGLSAGRYDLTDSSESTQLLGYGGFGFDLDSEGNHKIDLSAFYTQKDERTIEMKENGFLPNLDYGPLNQAWASGSSVPPLLTGFATPEAWIQTSREDSTQFFTKGPIYFTNFNTSTAFDKTRDLLVTQINGDHTLHALEGLHVSWAANYANTSQDENARGTRIFFEPNDPTAIPSTIPPSIASLGPGVFATPEGGVIVSGDNIDEHQYFGRLDADYQREITDALALKLDAGGWFEKAQRGVSASFLQNPTPNLALCNQAGSSCAGTTSQFVFFEKTAQSLGHEVFRDLLVNPKTGDFSTMRDTSNKSVRKISAGDLGAKATLWDQIDLLGGMRLERIQIDSFNDPFTGETRFGVPDISIFPEAYLFFDRLDNVNRGEVFPAPPPGTIYNDQIIGIKVPVDPKTGLVDLTTRQQIAALVNGHIDETRLLPSAGIAYRPLEGLALRGAYSQTVARPSFREIGYYVSVEPGTDDLTVGNPQLKLSDVESYDLRSEYSWGDLGDLAALSAFFKRIDNPIESIILRNPLNKETDPFAIYRTFFNNPNTARLWGIEAESRKNLGFVGLDAAQYFSVGANFTYIHARVGRTQAELQRALPFFGAAPGDVATYSGLKQSRRLFGQPEWIANADLTFDQPEWGTKATLAFFAISDVLDAAGSTNLRGDGSPLSFTLDRYVDSFSRLDLIVSQTVHWDLLGGDVIFKISGKNLTDTTRRTVYDPAQTNERIPERSYKLGRELKFTLTFAF